MERRHGVPAVAEHRIRPAARRAAAALPARTGPRGAGRVRRSTGATGARRVLAAAAAAAGDDERRTAEGDDRGAASATTSVRGAATATPQAAVRAATAAVLSARGDEDRQRPGSDRHSRRERRARAALAESEDAVTAPPAVGGHLHEADPRRDTRGVGVDAGRVGPREQGRGRRPSRGSEARQPSGRQHQGPHTSHEPARLPHPPSSAPRPGRR